MKVVLLAGGYGTRISEESYLRPKPMIEIGEMPILWHIMNGDNRFSMLEKTIDSITPKVLMSQLNEMEESGLILKHVLVSTPPKVVVYEINPEYSGICEIVNIAHSFSRMYGTKNNIDILTKK